MNDHRDPHLKGIFDEIVARTPELGPTPSPEMLSGSDRHNRSHRVVLAAAASVVALGVAGLAWAVTANDDSEVPVAAPIESSVAETTPPTTLAGVAPTAPSSNAPDADTVRGGPTLYPVLDPAAVDNAALSGHLTYVGANVKAQTNAVVARLDDGVSSTDLYTFVAGDGVSSYAEGVGLVTDEPTPQLVDVKGFGYAAWTTNDVPVLVMAADPAVLLDDPAFSMTVTATRDGGASIEFVSLPEGFETLVEPRRFAGEAATARLLVGPPDLAGAGVVASLDNPLTNLNLTEGTTITPTNPTEPGDVDGWIVSSPESDSRALVWSPDGTTWVSLHLTGSEEELLTIARAVTFTESAGEWMTIYGVDLPPVHVDASTASG